MIALVGLMGTGKTTVGRAIVDALGWELVDSDRVLEAERAATAKELAAEEGPDDLHAVEAAIALRYLDRGGPVVLTMAASTIEDAAVRDRLADGALVVWLTAPPEVLGPRAAGGAHRPLLGDDPVGALRSMAARRDPLFAEVADLVLDVTDAAPDALAAAVLAALT